MGSYQDGVLADKAANLAEQEATARANAAYAGVAFTGQKNTTPLNAGPSMGTQVNREVTGLDPAISYAKALAMFAGEHGQAGNEGYIGFLQQSKVAGVALASAHQMQEAFANAQAAAAKHEQELAKQKSVQEAYNANPDAGDKQFQTNGQ